jgi:hypothetical protein
MTTKRAKAMAKVTATDTVDIGGGITIEEKVTRMRSGAGGNGHGATMMGTTRNATLGAVIAMSTTIGLTRAVMPRKTCHSRMRRSLRPRTPSTPLRHR